MSVIVICIVSCLTLCSAQDQIHIVSLQNELRALSERVGNFSIELLYHTSQTLRDDRSFILSPITVWTTLAAVGAGSTGKTRNEIYNAIRWNTIKDKNSTSNAFTSINFQWSKEKVDTMTLEKVNHMFVDEARLPLSEYKEFAKKKYDLDVIALDFKENEKGANALNKVISNVTHGFIKKIVEPDYFQGVMVLASALYFKGKWTVPFKTSSTSRMPFYNSEREKIGEVNMMYNRFTYPFANLELLKARGVEIPYGKENMLSMIVLLPYENVSVKEMFKNFQYLNLKAMYYEFKANQDKYPDLEVDLYLPRFKIVTDLELNRVLKGFGISDLFDQSKATLPYMARLPLYASKIVHKVDLEVTEEGVTASDVPPVLFDYRIDPIQFRADSPFVFIIVEKLTYSILFAGWYETP